METTMPFSEHTHTHTHPTLLGSSCLLNMIIIHTFGHMFTHLVTFLHFWYQVVY